MDGADVLDLAVRHLAELPRETTLVARATSGERLVFTTSAERYQTLVAQGEAVWSPVEYEALVEGAEQGHTTPDEVARWAALKRETPGGFRVTRKTVWGRQAPAERHVEGDVWIGDARSGEGTWCRHGWTWDVLLRWLGLELVKVDVEPERAQEGAA